jgi:hypothetical protein
MPELDFMVVADYVRAEGGMLHMIAAGVDTMFVPSVPAVRPVGVGARILVDVAEAREEHHVELIYQDEDGNRLFQVSGTIGPISPDQPFPAPGRSYGVPIAFNIPLPVPRLGDYSLELLIDGEQGKSITLTVVQIQPPASPSDA